jgi:hypothetical protein
LRAEDVQGDDENLDDLDLLLWSKGEVCALLRNGIVQALVIHHQRDAGSERGIKIGSSLKEVEAQYPLELDPGMAPFRVTQDERASGWLGAFPTGQKDKTSKKATSGKAYRYDGLGIGFEIVNDKVVAITLYPALARNESTP